MKVCFVVLAHHQPEVFRLLLKNVASQSADIVVHIDRRADQSAFLTPDVPTVHFLKKRHRVHWTGWSLTKALCEALEEALAISDADYFIFLAGTDFPIRSSRVLTAYLQSVWPANLLNYYPLVPGVWGYGMISRYHLVDLRSAFGSVRAARQRGLWHRLVRKIETQLNSRYSPRNTHWTRFYRGSSRWCLNRDTVRFVVECYRSKSSRKLRQFLRLSAASDEIYFQTAILNSIHKAACLGFDESEALDIFAGLRPAMPDEKRVYIHYIDWSPNREDPAILDDSDFERVKQSGKFFACKCTDDKSLGLIQRIEAELLQGS